MSVNEIADALNCSVNTVKSRLNYARKKIGKEIAELEKKGVILRTAAPVHRERKETRKILTAQEIQKVREISRGHPYQKQISIPISG